MINTDKKENITWTEKSKLWRLYEAQYDKLIEYDYPAALAEESLMLIQQKAKKDYNAATAATL